MAKDRLSVLWGSVRSLFRRTHDLQPLTDYFSMLQTFVEKGLLEVLPAMSEAYVTEPAMHVLADTDDLLAALQKLREDDALFGWHQPEKEAFVLSRILERFKPVLSGIRLYTTFLNTSDEAYKEYVRASEQTAETPYTNTAIADRYTAKRAYGKFRNGMFALHVVAHEHPHHLLYTLLYTTKRSLLLPWKRKPVYDIINYRGRV